MKRNEFELEVCANSIQSAIAADQGGADRIELCDNLFEGGTTPSAGLFQIARQSVDIDIFPIIRPRGGDFLYSEYELNIMMKDIDLFRQMGADGFVFGCLKPDGIVDYENCSRLMEETKGLPVTFHRAFDMAKDPTASLDTIKKLGIKRLLTSGQKNKAIDGIPLIKDIVEGAGEKIIIMAGSGVDENNIGIIAKQTGVNTFHVSLRKSHESRMEYRKDEIYMGGLKDIPEFENRYTIPNRVKECIRILEND